MVLIYYVRSLWCFLSRHPLIYEYPYADEHGSTVRMRYCYCTAINEREYV